MTYDVMTNPSMLCDERSQVVFQLVADERCIKRRWTERRKTRPLRVETHRPHRVTRHHLPPCAVAQVIYAHVHHVRWLQQTSTVAL